MVADFGWFRRGGEVRRATSPTHAVKLRSQGWQATDAPAEVAETEPATPSLDLTPEPEHVEPAEEPTP